MIPLIRTVVIGSPTYKLQETKLLSKWAKPFLYIHPCRVRLSTFYAESLCPAPVCCGDRLSTFYAESLCLVPVVESGSANPSWVCGVAAQQILAELVELRLSKSLLSLWSQGSANPYWVCEAAAQQILAELAELRLSKSLLRLWDPTWHLVLAESVSCWGVRLSISCALCAVNCLSLSVVSEAQQIIAESDAL